MFAALALSENGCAPILLEQGDAVEERTKRVEDFWKNGDEALDIRSNVQFGEGGAGTFSDGKLNTLVKDTSEETGKFSPRLWRWEPILRSFTTMPHISEQMCCGMWLKI
mgnify:CR=1 FL=1